MLARARLLPLAETVLAVLLACIVEVAVRSVPLPVLATRLGLRLATGEVDVSLPDVLPRWTAVRLRAVARVMRHWPAGPKGKCLRAALVGGQRLRRLKPELVLGVRPGPDGVAAHAWLAVGGRSLDPLAGDYGQLLGR